MKHKILSIIVFVFLYSNIFAQTVEKLISTSIMIDQNYDYEAETGDGSPSPHPTEFYVDELENNIVLSTSSLRQNFIVNNGSIKKDKFTYFQLYKGYYQFPGFILSAFDDYVEIISLDSKYKNAGMSISGGISFLLKKDGGYIVYCVDKSGKPLALDTFGKKYNNREAIAYLKVYDSEKYEESTARAEELGLKDKFDLCEVLVWGQTYYNTVSNLENYWNNREWLYLTIGDPINYDLNGYGYQFLFSESSSSQMVCVNPKGDWEFESIILNRYSDILERHKKGVEVTGYWIVMPTGNAYYLINDKTQTEIFRIRNTWDCTNFYTLAINGYTDDFYGEYVTGVLSKMSKSELRVLRNTVFALYGVSFKTEDLEKYFNKQVWYTDEGKSFVDVRLPENRQKLVEMIQQLENK